jgi:hypothetical protein
MMKSVGGNEKGVKVSHSIVEVIYNPERNARVEVFRRENGTFGFSELRFHNEEKTWAPYGRYSEAVVDSAESAIREAKGRVDWLADALKPKSYTLSWIRSLSHDQDAMFISPDIPVHRAVARDGDHSEGLGPRIAARQILRVGGLYLVETIEKADNWFMGDRQGDGPIYCWSSYGSLEDAIRSL